MSPLLHCKHSTAPAVEQWGTLSYGDVIARIALVAANNAQIGWTIRASLSWWTYTHLLCQYSQCSVHKWVRNHYSVHPLSITISLLVPCHHSALGILWETPSYYYILPAPCLFTPISIIFNDMMPSCYYQHYTSSLFPVLVWPHCGYLTIIRHSSLTIYTYIVYTILWYSSWKGEGKFGRLKQIGNINSFK